MATYSRERVGIGVLETDVVYPHYAININKQLSLSGDAIDVLSLLIGHRNSVVIDGFMCTTKNNKIVVSRGRCYVKDTVVSVVENVELTPIVGTYYICLRYMYERVSILLMTPLRYQHLKDFCVYLSTVMWDGSTSIRILIDNNVYQPLIPQSHDGRSEGIISTITARATHFIPKHRVVRIVGELVSLADCRDVGYSNSCFGISLEDVSMDSSAEFLLTGVVRNSNWNLSLDAPIVLGRDGLVVQSIESTGSYVVYLGRVISSSVIYFMPTISVARDLL